MNILRWFASALGGLALVLVVIAVFARFSDGPLGPFQGGPLVAGERVTGEVDWSFVREVGEIELQLVEPPRSRTTWILYDDGQIYIPCGLPSFRLWKQWPHQALADGRAVMRIQGRLYEGQMVRIEDDALHGRISQRIHEKYGVGGTEPESVWIFRVDPRA